MKNSNPDLDQRVSRHRFRDQDAKIEMVSMNESIR